MDDFCGSQFWDTDLSWNTENSTKGPDLTPCFQNTVLVWLPCGFLWIFSAFNFMYNYRSHFNTGSSSSCGNNEIENAVSSTREKNMKNGLASKKVKIVRSTNNGILEDAHEITIGTGTGTCTGAGAGSNLGPIPWNAFNVSKVVICLFLILTQIVRLHVSISWELEVSHPVDIYTPILRIATYILVLTSIIISKNKGNCSSIIQFAFWSLLSLCQFFKFRTTLLHVYDQSQNNNDTDNIILEQEDTSPIIIIMLGFFDYCLIIVQFLLHCWADSYPTSKKNKSDASDKTTDERLQCPEHSASALGSLLFSWFDTLAWKGFNKPLETKDIWELNTVDTAQELTYRFEKSWKRKQEDKNKRYISKNLKNASSARVEVQQVGVSSVIWSVFSPSLLAGFALVMVPTLLVFVSPKVLSALIAFMSSDEDTWKGYFYAGLLFVISFVSTICTVHYQHIMFTLGMRVKSALTSALYKKILVISNSARKESTAGEIVNLMSVDVNNVSQLITFIQMLWTSPFQITLALYFLFDILGPSIFAGVGVIIILIPINLVLREYVRSCQVEQMASKDERVKLISEIITGIKILKLYAWEPSFEEEILKIRQKEINTLTKTAYLQAVFDFLWSCCQFMVAVSTFATYVLVDETHVLNAQTVFVSLALFNAMNFPLTLLPRIIVLATQTSVSIGRLNKFLNAEEIDTGAISHDAGEACPIVIENGHFSWDRRDDIGTDGQAKKTGDGGDKNVLKNINISVQEGTLVAVVGTVGSGKSSLLSAILGELEKTSGRVNTKGSISYVGQQPWIQNGSLRENLLFGKPFDAHNYTEVIDSCALGPDLDIFPGRDKIEIGEKGINLSGGQKQRVSIARAVYNNSDLYLLDDPLSAVDSHVGKHIFEKVLSSNGLLQKKTRVFVTNSLHFLPQVDHVYVMKDGRISENGTYEELLKQKGEFFELVSQYNQEFDSENKGKTDGDAASTDIFNSLEDTPRKKSIRFLIENGTKTKTEENGNAGTGTKKEENIEEQEKLIQKERMETESVKWSTYIDYFRAAGWSRVFATVFFYAVYQVFSIGSNFWLTVWSNEPIINGTQGNRDLYLGVYTSLGVAQSVAFVLATTLMGLAALRSSSVLHFGMLTRVLKAPMSFFDTTPTGRILSRFSKDVDVMDSVLPMYIRILLYTFTTVLATLGIIIFSTPYFTLVIIPISIFYYFVQKFYVPTSRQLKRLESVTRSPIYSHFGETINGTSTIRAYGEQKRFISESDSKVDENQACYYPSIVSNRWLIIRLEAAGSLIIFFSAVFAVLNRDSLNPGLVGLTISYALQISFCLGTLVRTVCDFETNIVAAERIKEYGEVPQEEPWTYDWKKPESTWPASGAVEFKNYQTRYRDGLDLVLNNITCRIEPGEKIGVVGRTGAGKSSLTLALFRIIEGVNEGSITIDGEDIRKLGLHDVRSRLTIIPQDPVLFSGTLRFNLDPFFKYSDSAVWRALELSNLKNFVGGLQGGLEFKVSEGGDNLSVGQKQLVCLSRALLRKSKILILDEATAAVDLETDELIQRTIRKEFKNSTVITIAHRLNTIMDSTRVMVINNGVIREFESPGKLLENSESQFYRMANDAGLISK